MKKNEKKFNIKTVLVFIGVLLIITILFSGNLKNILRH